MTNNINKEIEDLKAEVTKLKIKLRKIEEYLLSIPKVNDYIYERDSNDELFEEAKKIVGEYDTVSASFLQRRLSIGYARAARILDQLTEAKIIGYAEGSKPRKVLKNTTKKKGEEKENG